MGSSVNFPVGRDGSSTALSVAELNTELALAVIEPLCDDIAAMQTLPPVHFPDDFYTPKVASGTSHTERSAPVHHALHGTGPDGAIPVNDVSGGPPAILQPPPITHITCRAEISAGSDKNADGRMH